jgi:hypothetical protein
MQTQSLKELSSLFSYVFTAKDCIFTEDSILKDLSKLLPTRSKDSIIVVDTHANNVDPDVSAFVFQNKYTGHEYTELLLLKTALVSNLGCEELPMPPPPHGLGGSSAI